MHLSLTDSQLDAFALDGYLLIDNFLEEKIAFQLLEELKHWKEQEAFRLAGIGKLLQFKIKEEFRKDEIKWIDRENCLDATKIYLNTLEKLMEQLSREFYLSLKDFESMYAIYPEGAYYKKHKDRFQQQAHRIISVVLYLNVDWETKDAGELVIYPDNQNINVEPKFNRLVFFKSELLHEVLPCNNTRYSITTWLKDQFNEVNFL